MTQEILNAFKSTKVADEVKVSEYRLMYLWGAWITSTKIYAENDAEAVHDADEAFNADEALQRWRYGVALWHNGHIVKAYKPMRWE